MSKQRYSVIMVSDDEIVNNCQLNYIISSLCHTINKVVLFNAITYDFRVSYNELHSVKERIISRFSNKSTDKNKQ